MTEKEPVKGKWATEAYDFLRLYRRIQGHVYGLVLLQFAWAVLMVLINDLGGENGVTSLGLPSYDVDSRGDFSVLLVERPLTEIYVFGAILILFIWLLISRLYVLAVRPAIRFVRGALSLTLGIAAFIILLLSLPLLLYTIPASRRRAAAWLAQRDPDKVNALKDEHGEKWVMEFAAGEAGFQWDLAQQIVGRTWRRLASYLVPDVTIGFAQIESYSLDEERISARLPQQIFSNAALRLQDQLSRTASGYQVEVVTLPDFLRVRSTDSAKRILAWMGIDALLWGAFETTDAERVWLNISSRSASSEDPETKEINYDAQTDPLYVEPFEPRTLIVDVQGADDAYLAMIVALDHAIAGRSQRFVMPFVPDAWMAHSCSLRQLVRRLIVDAPQPTWHDQTPTGSDFARTHFVDQICAWLRDYEYGFNKADTPDLAVLSQMSTTAILLAPENPRAHFANSVLLFAEDRPDLAKEAIETGWKLERPWRFRNWAYMAATAGLRLEQSDGVGDNAAVNLGIVALYAQLAVKLSPSSAPSSLATDIEKQLWYQFRIGERPQTKRFICSLANLDPPKIDSEPI